MSTYSIKVGATLPPLQGIIKDDTGPIDLTGSTATFYMSPKEGGDPVIIAPATIVDAVNGVVSYQWVDGDTDIQGEYEGEFEIVWSNGNLRSPSDRYISIKIYKKLQPS